MFDIKDAETVFPDAVYSVIINLLRKTTAFGVKSDTKGPSSDQWCAATTRGRNDKKKRNVRRCHQTNSLNLQRTVRNWERQKNGAIQTAVKAMRKSEGEARLKVCHCFDSGGRLGVIMRQSSFPTRSAATFSLTPFTKSQLLDSVEHDNKTKPAATSRFIHSRQRQPLLLVCRSLRTVGLQEVQLKKVYSKTVWGKLTSSTNHRLEWILVQTYIHVTRDHWCQKHL